MEQKPPTALIISARDGGAFVMILCPVRLGTHAVHPGCERSYQRRSPNSGFQTVDGWGSGGRV
jgi:hypothetical protein